ncbi:MAG: response regulator, partial [Alphaproteobacteria bacterium]|nr:response regulator [Alphaproteobacteria bacterium]
ELDVFEVPIRTLIYGILEAMAVKVQGKPVELRHDIAQEVPFVVIGDPKRLRQILMNLMGNALKFTESGAVTIRVTRTCRTLSVAGDAIGLRFEVVDTGIGMPQTVADRLFQPFTQADSSTSRKFGGTGLGLSICKKLVELMGGYIGVTSQEGQGSIFWFEIPTQEVSTEATTVELPSLDGISVLSVEDHPQGAKEIVRSLQSMGAKVESCPTCQEALALVTHRPFDVGVIDQGLPDGLGLDLIRRIMDVRPFMGLIMYTVRDDSGLQHSLQSLGVTYLSKPASRAGLGEAVRDAASKVHKVSTDGPTRLLIAEDTASVREVLRRQLDKLGVEADFAYNGREALVALQSGQYGILLTDLHMPEMDGYGVVKTIREQEEKEGNKQNFPVIVLTADVQMAQRQVYMSYGFDECLLKPVSLGQFRRLLIRWGLLEEREESPQETQNEPTTNNAVIPPAIDMDAVRQQMGGLDESTIQMLRLFPGMIDPVILRLRQAHEKGDHAAVREAAHSLKGGARSACCTVLGDLAADLQTEAEEKNPAGELVHEILEEFERVKTAIAGL